MSIQPNQTLNSFSNMVARQGGGLIFYQNKVYPINSKDFFTAARKVPGYHKFTVSIYNRENDTDEVSLTLLISPSDITIGNSAVTSNTYTREGWVTTIWGKQQTTLTGSGVTAGFYVPESGLTNINRKNSLSFIDFQTLIAIFKNNGYYFLTNPKDQTLWKDGFSRVINVMDSVKIDYDGTSYLGSFSTFTVDESVDSPYKMSYNFEFVVSAINDDIIEGHVRQKGNEYSSGVVLDIQGSDTNFSRTVRMSVSDLNREFKYDELVRPKVREGYNILYGSAEKNKGYQDKPYLAHKVGRRTYESLPESDKEAVRELAKKYGLSESTLAGLIAFESDGTFSPLVQNPFSPAQGIGQWMPIAIVDMVPLLKKENLLGATETIEDPAALVARYPTFKEQVQLMDIYIRSKVMAGRRMDAWLKEAPTQEEKLKVLLSGWFYPGYVDNPEDELLPQSVRDDNPNIRTMGDYYRGAKNRINELRNLDKPKTVTQDGGE